MFVKYLQKNKISREIIYKGGIPRSADMISRFESFLKKGDEILDIGSGTCSVCEILSNRGYKVTPLDVKDLSFRKNIKPIIYDGDKIPFGDNKFDVALILTVLHHTPDPKKILKEAKRVSKKIVIIEDIYSNWLHKHITYFFDSLLNLEFKDHPHTNKSDEEWKRVFKEVGLKLVSVKYNYSFVVFKHATYCLEK